MGISPFGTPSFHENSRSFFQRSHPWLAATGVLISSVVVIRLYCRHSLGVCTCPTDLTGKTVVITGGNSGIGKATAMELARRNARVIIGCKDEEEGLQAVKEIKATTGSKTVTYKPLDLCNFDSVRNFSKNLKETEGRLHILINNAGIVSRGGKREITEDGCEYIMQTNYLGHFLLTLSLGDLMVKNAPSRIINVASNNYKWAKMDLQDMSSWKKFSDVDAYNKSKLAVVLFTTELARRLEGTGVTVNALHPGVVKTNIVKSMPWCDGFITRMLFMFFGKTPFEGAQTSIHLALAPELERVSGQFFSDCKQQKLAKSARDQEQAQELFKISQNIVEYRVTGTI